MNHDSPPVPSPARTLKIEADGDFAQGRLKPKIRLMGHWLERAGFAPGGRVHITCERPGVLVLREVVTDRSPPPNPPSQMAERLTDPT